MYKRLSRYLLSLVIILGAMLAMLSWMPPAQATEPEPDLIITGTGLKKDVMIYPNDWSKYLPVIRKYSSNNNWDFHKIWKVKGYDLFELIGKQNLKTDQYYNITFIGNDGFRVTKTVNELKSQYYYPKFTVEGGQRVEPMIGFYAAALYEPKFQGMPDPSQVVWEDRDLTEADRDKEAPRLYMGQAAGQVSDRNQPYFVKKLARIVVGEERPTGDDGDDGSDDGDDSGSGGGGTGTTTPPGGGSSGTGTTQPPGGGGSGTGTTKPPAGGSQPPMPDPGKEQDPGDSDEADQPVAGPGEESEEPGDEEEGEDDPAVKPEEEEADLENEAGSKKRKVVWPWIASGAVLAAGGAGGVCYYIIRRKRG